MVARCVVPAMVMMPQRLLLRNLTVIMAFDGVCLLEIEIEKGDWGTTFYLTQFAPVVKICQNL